MTFTKAACLVLFSVSAAVASVQLGDTLVPTGSFPSHSATYGKGGLIEFASTNAMQALPANQRTAGMVASVVGGSLYVLGADLTTWTAYSASGTNTVAGIDDVFGIQRYTADGIYGFGTNEFFALLLSGSGIWIDPIPGWGIYFYGRETHYGNADWSSGTISNVTIVGTFRGVLDGIPPSQVGAQGTNANLTTLASGTATPILGTTSTKAAAGDHTHDGYVPSTRTITINGTSYDLSANRSWTVTGGSGSGTPANTNQARSYLVNDGTGASDTNAYWTPVPNSYSNLIGTFAYGTNFYGVNATSSTSHTNDAATAWSWTVPAGCYYVRAKLTGGGGGGGEGGAGGAGGWLMAAFAVVPGDTLSGYTGMGGMCTGGTAYAWTWKSYPGGGKGRVGSTTAWWAGGGGGYTSLRRNGALYGLAAGGGGAARAAVGGAGGNTTGVVGGGNYPGGAGSQVAGGAAGAAGATAGGSLYGGNGEYEGGGAGGGGGAGYYGGGGGRGYGATVAGGSGGGGSNRLNVESGLGLRGNFPTDDDYIAPYGTAGGGVSGTPIQRAGGPGRVYIQWNITL